jgi:hypothetical protein
VLSSGNGGVLTRDPLTAKKRKKMPSSGNKGVIKNKR